MVTRSQQSPIQRQRRMKNKDKPFLRKKSELPHDQFTIKALNDHKRSDEYLASSPELTSTS
ncbi:hypothetical protein Avbf_07437 [Armadillidium vulgare]|nr:hypothetical protein Avbf_07437 [Armadillidium vulgare]